MVTIENGNYNILAHEFVMNFSFGQVKPKRALFWVQEVLIVLSIIDGRNNVNK